MRELVSQGTTQNIKSAKRMVERVRPEVWDILDQVIKEHPVLLNRAPTLHRLGIQAFMPVLVEGSAIQIHPLVCTAFNADFDGDQMAVHVPLFSGAVAEAKNLMMSSNNILNASNGSPVVAPTQDIVLGSYYLTQEDRSETQPDPASLRAFASTEEAMLAFEHGTVDLHEKVRVRMEAVHLHPHRASEPGAEGTELVVTTVGRVIFNDVLPLGEIGADNDLPALTYRNEVMDLRKLGQLVKECYDLHGAEPTAQIVNNIKRLGFHYATRAGVTVSAMDIKTPHRKQEIIEQAERDVEEVDLQFRRGLITDDERYLKTVEIWTRATDDVTRVTMDSFDRFHSILMMSQSGARGSTQQIRQLAGMRGLMADPTGRIIDLPIKANFSEGLTVLEYFISTHGARKGLADTALRTADSGYLTRRLVDVAQDVIVRIEDCETTAGIWVELEDSELVERVLDRYQGRIAAQDITIGDELLVPTGGEIDDEAARRIYREREAIGRVKVRSIMTCKAREGVCRMCYGRNLATGRLVEIGEAVGVIAAQSIGEPGTQLTMRTFHTGGVATGGSDITQGLPRVEELFEARVPKGKALISEIDGSVEVIRGENRTLKIKVTSRDVFDTTYAIPSKFAALVQDNQDVNEGGELLRGVDEHGNDVVVRAKYAGKVKVGAKEITVRTTDEESREYAIPAAAQIVVRDGDHVSAGDKITEGSVSPQELLLVRGRDEVQNYLVREVQRVYRSQGVEINDKHIEVIVRQMMRKVRIDNAGDTDLLPGEIVSQFEWEEANAKALSEGGEPAIAQTVLLGLIKAALNTASWLSAASFQETTRVLTEAAISGKIDKLRGLKENVIIGKLIPAGTGLDYYQKLREEAIRLFEEEEEAAAAAAAGGGDGVLVGAGVGAEFGDIEGSPSLEPDPAS
ncbi:MAG: DNA-directed RNA polymerase subunit beta', partial [Candidatus Dormibacteraeota bacterium]|nr:DNA-directed RNA polymerase subunit beta' [Candidatus Dormibacteraeota bacterium]